jgi:hypothetical protein
MCVKIDGEDKSREKDYTVELNKSNDIRASGRWKGTGRDGPFALSLNLSHSLISTSLSLTTVCVCVCVYVCV